MSVSRKIQDGGGDSLPVYTDGEQIKLEQNAERPSSINPYEGSQQQRTETGKKSAREEEKTCTCPQTEEYVEQQQSSQVGRPVKSVPHRRHEDQRHLLQFDYPQPPQVPHAKKSLQKSRPSLPATLTDGFSDEEMESSPLIEDRSKEMRLARQREYKQELCQQIAQREEMRQQQRAKKNFRAAQRSQATSAAAAAAATAALRNRSSVESYENQLRMEQLEAMRKQLQLQREREIQRLRRIYRKNDKRFLAHLQRLNLNDSDPYSPAKGDGIGDAPKESVPLKEKPLPPVPASESKTSESKPEVTKPKHDVDVSHAGATKTASPRKLRRDKKAETKEKEVTLKSHQPPSTSTVCDVEKSQKNKPVTYKHAYLRLQKQRREEEMRLEERRAKAAAWIADRARQERLEREMRNMAEWRSGHSLAGVSLMPIAPAQRVRFEAASSWLEKQRAAQQEKRVHRDKQLMSWREEKDALFHERRLKEKAEQKIAREMLMERKKEAEKCYDRWLHEIRARKAAERASVPRGAIGVSTYSSAYSLPSPWRQPSKQSWRRKSIMSTSLKRKDNDDVPQ